MEANPQVQHAAAFCSRCGDNMGMESARFRAARGVTECTMCRLAPPEFERAVATGIYDETLREMLHRLKFEGHRRIAAHVLGTQLAQAMARLSGAASDAVVVAVPLHADRLKRRGFNQAEVLAEEAVKRSGHNLRRGVMERSKQTPGMFALNPEQRRKNLRGAFRVVDAGAVRGREVILVDDIMTTGATARECARVLRRAGAVKVWVVTVARTVEERAMQMRDEDVARWDSPAQTELPL